MHLGGGGVAYTYPPPLGSSTGRWGMLSSRVGTRWGLYLVGSLWWGLDGGGGAPDSCGCMHGRGLRGRAPQLLNFGGHGKRGRR